MKYSKTAPVKIIVLGAGGTGGYVIPHLYRIEYAAQRSMRIIVCDGDVVEEKNLIRQSGYRQKQGAGFGREIFRRVWNRMRVYPAIYRIGNRIAETDNAGFLLLLK